MQALYSQMINFSCLCMILMLFLMMLGHFVSPTAFHVCCCPVHCVSRSTFVGCVPHFLDLSSPGLLGYKALCIHTTVRAYFWLRCSESLRLSLPV